MEISIDTIREFVANEILTLPELCEHSNEINVLLTGSRASGGYTDTSDIDLDILCPQSIFTKIQQNFYHSGKTSSLSAAYYSLLDSNFERYFGDISTPHFSIAPEEKIISKVRQYDEVQMWIWKHAIALIDNGISERLSDDMFRFPGDVLLKKLKKHYLEFLYSVIDAYPSHTDTEVHKHVAAYSIYNGLMNLYRFCFLAENQPFPYTEKLVTHVKATRIYKECTDVFNEIYYLLENLSGNDAWQRLEKARGMLLYDDVYESSVKIGRLLDAALLSAGCEKEWVTAGYNNIDELLYGM